MKTLIASLLRRGKYERAEKVAYKNGVNYFEFTDMVSIFFKENV